mgnify:CR=1 FL=1
MVMSRNRWATRNRSFFLDGTGSELTFNQITRPVFVRVYISKLPTAFPKAMRFLIGQEAQQRG